MSTETTTPLLDLFHEYRAAESAYRRKVSETDRLAYAAGLQHETDPATTLARLEEDAQARVMGNVHERLCEALIRQDIANYSQKVANR